MKAPPPFDTQLLSRLPGSELIREGLDDAYAGVESVNALLVEIAAPRLREFGMSVPEFPAQPLDAEIRLYRRLGAEFAADAYGQYNSLLRRLTSFNRAMERALRRAEER
jgi:hypothetical protein